jgi:hypothetical protein
LADVILDRAISAPTLLAAGRGPQRIGFYRIPGRHMNAVGYGPNWDFLPWPAGKQGLENLSAHFPMELADAIDLPAAADREISHVEGFRIVFRILPSHGEQVIHRDCEFIHCIVVR